MKLQEAPRIDICIATYKRPELLAELLASIAGQKVASTLEVRLIVVDNDKHASARSVVEEFKRKSALPLMYEVEPEQNIALARNRCLSHATGDVVVFIDDDEYAEETWLAELVSALDRYQADAVFGPVLPVYPPGSPAWVRRGKFFDRPRYPSGTALNSGATNNTAVRRAVFSSREPARFDPAYGLTGGEDTDLFDRVRRNGGKLIWCDTALVREKVPMNRQTVASLLKRAFRGGQGYALVRLRHLSPWRKVAWFFSRLALVAVSLVFVVVATLAGKHRLVKAIRKLCTNVGQLSVLTGYRYREYGAHEYRPR